MGPEGRTVDGMNVKSLPNAVILTKVFMSSDIHVVKQLDLLSVTVKSTRPHATRYDISTGPVNGRGDRLTKTKQTPSKIQP